MPQRFQHNSSFMLPAVLAFLGSAYCLLVYLGFGEDLCITAGCSLYKGAQIAGISMWVIGLAAFLLLLLTLATGFGSLAAFLVVLFLLGDCGLLLLMGVTSSCLSCLGVALIFALIYISLRSQMTPQAKGGSSKLLLLWGVLFAFNLVSTVKELLPPEPMAGEASAPVHLYFSPSCPSCLEMLQKLPKDSSVVAYYPVSKSEEDVATFAAVQAELEQGLSMPEAVNKVLNASPPPRQISLWENLPLRWKMLRNKAVIMIYGSGSVPFTTIKGAPQNPASLSVSDMAAPEATPSQAQPKQPPLPAPPTKTDTPQTAPGNNMPEGEAPKNKTADAKTSADKLSGGKIVDEKILGNILRNSTDFGLCTDKSPEKCD